MLKIWSFWKTLVTNYLAVVTAMWLFGQIYAHFTGDALKQLLGPLWSVIFFLVPLVFAFPYALLRNAKEESQVETLDGRNRGIMLDHVEKFWVKGVLEKSLHGAALLALGIKEDPGVLSYPWTIKKEATGDTLPAGKSMLEIFGEIGMGRSLLILGAPGSGKTTMLLELTRQLIGHARQNESEPIPIVFHLASWTQKQTLSEWLVEQLNILYYVPKKTGPACVSESKMLLLLDGLDEVKQEDRVKCVEAINQFRNEHGLTSLVVCSRIEEYASLKTKLSFEGAISLQPLTRKQVNAYFEKFGRSLAGVKTLLKKDTVLRELAETPLMLSIIALAYKDTKADTLIAAKNVEEQRKHLLDTYITRMFEPSTRTAKAPFTQPQTLHYLSWLARIMIQHNVIPFQIEALQPFWLENKSQRRLYVIFSGLILGLFLGLSGSLIPGLFLWLREGLSGMIIALVIGLLLALFFGLATMLVGRLTDNIAMVDKLDWSWKRARRGLIVGLISGLIGGPVVLLFAEWGAIDDYGPIPILLGGLGVGLWLGLGIFGPILAWLGGLSGKQMDETTRPGQRLRQTLSNAVFVAISNGLWVGLCFGSIFWVAGVSDLAMVPDPFFAGLPVLSFFALLFGLAAGLTQGGGRAFIQHHSLRFVLTRNELLPWHLVSFLEYAVDLIFLRRVGGSYIFVHRLMMEYFAELEV